MKTKTKFVPVTLHAKEPTKLPAYAIGDRELTRDVARGLRAKQLKIGTLFILVKKATDTWGYRHCRLTLRQLGVIEPVTPMSKAALAEYGRSLSPAKQRRYGVPRTTRRQK
jgi:hypothetical protein